uniref:Uncharacterized protein n=1 Tax=Rhizophora mucronata TaxID=61149 RepID=A0A2P2IM34_RHIMU
MCIVDPGLLG